MYTSSLLMYENLIVGYPTSTFIPCLELVVSGVWEEYDICKPYLYLVTGREIVTERPPMFGISSTLDHISFANFRTHRQGNYMQYLKSLDNSVWFLFV